jgi:hypothetical protein
MNLEKQIEKALKAAINNMVPVVVTEGKVTAVNKAERTCNVDRGEMPDLLNVRLNSIIEAGNDLLTIYPKAESNVLCIMIEKNPADAFLLSTNNIEEISGEIGGQKFLWNKNGFVFNDGQIGGMVKASELKTQSEKDKDVIDAILQVINSSVIPTASPGSPDAFQAALKLALTGKSTGVYTELENDKVKH